MTLKLIKRKDVPVRDFSNGLTLRILLDKIAGAKGLDLGTVTIPPHERTKMHARNFEEVIYMLSGKGQVITEKGEIYHLDAGDCILIPAGIKHCHANHTNEPLEQLYFFAPQATHDMQEALRNLPIL